MDTFHTITLSQTNCFLLKAAGGFLLIDCGGAGSELRFLAKLKRLGLTPQSIRYLFLTHHHNDHCGLLPFLLRENPDLRVIMGEGCAACIKTGRHFKSDGEICATKPLGLAIGMYSLISGKMTDAFTPYHSRAADILCRSHDVLLSDFTGIHGKFLHTPGHTGDSVSLVVGEHAFVGDAARNTLQFCGAPYEPMLHYDRALCFESWVKLLSAGANIIHPAHGAAFFAKHIRRILKKEGYPV